MPRTGEIGEQIHTQVEQLVGEGMSRSDAFARISEESGRRPGTVAANYYRVARKRAGGPLRQASGRSGRAAAAGRRRGRRGGGGSDIDRLADDIMEQVQSLVRAVREQSAEVEQMRARLEGIRRSLGS